jgi:hypothetical protein
LTNIEASKSLQYPAGDRDIDINVGVIGKFTDQRED